MRRANNLVAEVADIDNLRLAFWKARKGKSYAWEVWRYRRDLEQNLRRLQEQILDGNVETGHYRFFKIFDPKERRICAPAFEEQVLHHALMNICHPFFERAQIFDSYACRKGKGTYAALAQARIYTRRYRFFLKLDVQKFFDSIHHGALKNQLHRLIKDHWVLAIFYKIIDSYRSDGNEGRGVPIGNLSSQYFANHYLSGLDHFIKETLKIRAYVRYMDDIILWHDDKNVLKNARRAVQDFVEMHLQCALKPPLLNYCSRGIPFLGYLVFPYYLRLSQRSKKRFIRKWQDLQEKYDTGAWGEAECRRHALPLLAFTQHADAKYFRKKILNL